MDHTITFGNKNTWDDWHIVPKTRPIFAPPALKEKSLTIPGMDGLLDFTSAMRGFPVFENRKGSFEFLVMNEFYNDGFDYQDPIDLYEEIRDYLGGKRMQATLSDEPEYYYEGRFYVEKWQSGPDYSSITIAYEVDPFKKSVLPITEEEWLWDPFSFEYGVVNSGKINKIPLTTTALEYVYLPSEFGSEPVVPTFKATCNSSGIELKYKTAVMSSPKTFKIQNGTTTLPGLVFNSQAVSLSMRTISGTGTLTITFTRGEL